jgi:hypothetical protein
MLCLCLPPPAIMCLATEVKKLSCLALQAVSAPAAAATILCGMQVLGPGKPLELFYQDSKVKEVRAW